MENLELTTEEIMEIEKRGFTIRESITFIDFLKDIVIGIIIFGFIGGIIGWLLSLYYLDTVLLNSMIQYLPTIPLLIQIQHFLNYILGGKLFFGENNILAYGEILNSINSINRKSYVTKIIQFFRNNVSFMPSTGERSIVIFIYIPILLISSLWYWISPLAKNAIAFTLGILAISYVLIYICRLLLEKFHPLYAFGNIGEKIQNLTPQIEEKSKQIQREFQTDINFSVLSDEFDSLSTTFSEIALLVIKLEKAEKKANVGNLFDSEKYINSLRSDIVTPLNSLKTFLEKQKIELMQSQKELIRVRAGGSESTGNIELQSKRSESLIQELTENIGKLDLMIRKMGK